MLEGEIMVYLVQGARTAFGNYGGMFKNTTDIELGVLVVKAALEKSNIKALDVDEIIMGNVIQTTTSSAYLARHIGLYSGLTIESSALTVNRLCGSGMQAIVSAVQSIKLGDKNIVVAGGTENMSQAPQVLRDSRFGSPNKAPKVEDMLWGTLSDQYIGIGMGITAENLSSQYNISREEQDLFAIESHNKAVIATKSGRFEKEIVALELKDKKGNLTRLDRDERVRENMDLAAISSLKPSFKEDGTVTAANASGINDGAAAVVLMSEEAVRQYGAKPLAKVIAYATVGVDPTIMGIGPAPATLEVINKAGLTLSDIGLFEFNEAFSAQALAVVKELGIPIEKVNVNGGAVALGHPVGASGARITYSLALEMQLKKVKYGVASLCIGGGQGIAVLLESV